MNRLWLWLIVFTLSGCVSHEVVTPPGPVPQEQQVGAQASGVMAPLPGPETAVFLTQRYNDKRNMCRDNPSAPAFLCTGVMLRATQPSTQYHFWNPNPSSTGVSFSYLRADAKFSKLVFGYNNGFIFYPYFFKPHGKIEPEILCFFPVDGATNGRPDQGCGQSPGIAASRPCQDQGINTAAQYMTHYNQSPSKYGTLCGFNVRDSLNQGATTAFNEAIKAQGQGGNFAFATQNEFRLAKWAQDLGPTVPIEAVFYVNDSGKAGAQYDQRDFKEQTGIWVPAIRITLPQTTGAAVRFDFIPADQAISS
ncbi:hypothetical protein PSH79_03990 [Pseudomonas sp. FP2196]|uniref:hypothetical protein n=1 Tax=Pseudomonas sp. FP2196 TaxID=2954086 RepID=UPI00273723A1|nr:hypothetical protein [Pseudomonas sp. FP2196]WLH36457.1 hypothetical protein PSH79_03990 [Pseudomonas sp. FP2196]